MADLESAHNARTETSPCAFNHEFDIACCTRRRAHRRGRQHTNRVATSPFEKWWSDTTAPYWRRPPAGGIRQGGKGSVLTSKPGFSVEVLSKVLSKFYR